MSLSPRNRVLAKWIILTAVIVAGLFVFVSIKVSWKYAFSIVTGLAKPFHAHLGPAGVLLAIAGYLLVPVVVGSVVAALIGRHIELAYRNEAVDLVSARVIDDLAKRAEEAG